jgi:flagellar assembly protein FliH
MTTMGAPERFSRTIPKAKVGGASQWELRPLAGGTRLSGSAPLSARATDAAREQSGFEVGRAQGYADGMRSAQQARAADLQRLEALIAQLRGGFDELSTRTADVLLDLALDIAAQVVRRDVQTHRDTILPVVREALGMVIESHAHPTLRLAPADFALVRQALLEDGRFQGCRCVEDPSISAGGCRVETAHGEIDATLETRWRKVVQSLGCTTAPPQPAPAEPSAAAPAREQDATP